MIYDWEPSAYGFCAQVENDNESLASALEAIRRQVCAYGGRGVCDCKFGIEAIPLPKNFLGGRTINLGSEKTGCPELREMIHRLLYRPETFNG